MNRLLYWLSLVAMMAIIWIPIYVAQYLPYDENFGQLISSFLLSMLLLATGIVLMVRKTAIVMRNFALSVGFLIINSPLTVLIVMVKYERIFGTALDVG